MFQQRIPIETIEAEPATIQEQRTIFESMAHTAETMWMYVRLVPHFTTIVRGAIMKDWKTTVTGLVGAAALLINTWTGVAIPQDAIIAVALFAIGWFAKDGDKND